ncbi:hypothetical protein DER29_5855 [Micromonospora sp. M71_S20]|uniref:DUF6114 domain-containing protein n=1 Tax=Micromonospora sp. M71_S20 TaxID=592872 RepID=UPI000F29926A|nr:DUF6114 domain-containing protein [Micromonospora sp. M71_S20]RLK12573.1 hypothetical protein DER29_5855 [Micromonospora sp. M71_S20]
MTAGEQHRVPAARRPGGRWRRWRRGRPFTAGVLIALGGTEMLVTLRAPLGVLLHVGPQGLAAYLVPAVLVLCGVLLVATPQQRVFYAVLSLLLGLVSWLTSNLGGFLVGMLLTLVGGALAFAWTPDKRPPPTDATGAPGAPDPAAEDESALLPRTRTAEDEDGSARLPGARTPDPTPADRG